MTKIFNSVTYMREGRVRPQTIEFVGPVFLITGDPAAGKTTVGRHLAEHFGIPFTEFSAECGGDAIHRRVRAIQFKNGFVIASQFISGTRFLAGAFRWTSWLHLARGEEGINSRHATVLRNDGTPDELKAKAIAWAENAIRTQGSC